MSSSLRLSEHGSRYLRSKRNLMRIVGENLFGFVCLESFCFVLCFMQNAKICQRRIVCLRHDSAVDWHDSDSSICWPPRLIPTNKSETRSNLIRVLRQFNIPSRDDNNRALIQISCARRARSKEIEISCHGNLKIGLIMTPSSDLIVAR